jgi:hypothetical protein
MVILIVCVCHISTLESWIYKFLVSYFLLYIPDHYEDLIWSGQIFKCSGNFFYSDLRVKICYAGIAGDHKQCCILYTVTHRAQDKARKV